MMSYHTKLPSPSTLTKNDSNVYNNLVSLDELTPSTLNIEQKTQDALIVHRGKQAILWECQKFIQEFSLIQTFDHQSSIVAMLDLLSILFIPMFLCSYLSYDSVEQQFAHFFWDFARPYFSYLKIVFVGSYRLNGWCLIFHEINKACLALQVAKTTIYKSYFLKSHGWVWPQKRY